MANPKGSPENLVAIPKGVSGNPGGKPVGARNQITRTFLNALAKDFEEHGKECIKRCREDRPDKYLSVVAALVPKEVVITRPLEGITDDELGLIAERLRSQADLIQDRAGDSPPPLVQQPH